MAWDGVVWIIRVFWPIGSGAVSIGAMPNMVRDPQEYRQVVDQLCSFASECAELFARMETRH
ncbi:hypothetical protein ACFU5O_30490 [Streptomyces sp. NPDC057445]|uniref:hypothetical protein n=1 Tax=Streptomyces sp. NPDC057445 TaxID=3346136 RepID=UPI0036BF690D